MHWYKRDPDAALAGMAELTFEERGAYNGILDLIYSRDGNVPDDDAVVARILGAQPRMWSRLKNRLIERGKIWIKDGIIVAKRTEKTISEASELSFTQAEKANKRWKKTKNNNENNDPVMPHGNASTTTTTTTTREEDTAPDGAQSDWPKDFREKFWEAYPRKVSKKSALRELERIRKRGDVRWEPFYSAVQSYAKTADPAYTKHPDTWLRKGCWDDEPAKSETQPTMHTTEPNKPNWNPWRCFYRDTGQNSRAAMMDKNAADGKPWTVPTEYPPGWKAA